MPIDYDPTRWAEHTAYTDPGRHAELLQAVPPDLDQLSAVARNLIIHYRASAMELPEETKPDINARWLEAILDLDQQRHPGDLAAERDPLSRVQGCCRDHSLFAAAVLRQHDQPARIRYGFAGYFAPGFHVDHVVVERWLPDEHRWLRFDPEVEEPWESMPTPRDIPPGTGQPYETAAEAWTAYRNGSIDPQTYGVGTDVPIRGPWFLQCAVLIDAAFRAGTELLLWDGWGAMSDPDGPTEDQVEIADQLSELIMKADAGDVAAERELITRMQSDPTVAVPETVLMISPWGEPPQPTDLTRSAVIGS
ncbi:transglutaminase domain-containing protein [Microlunatus elymi]|uniref:Transglutaminase domain-containing protein n=2 Tax=Microlunatus elymi TaxID=2596828 RepID=A0A516Q6B5_9ACTN|nr:transglutaminase domain-containing protein [Microlunatus elymi]